MVRPLLLAVAIGTLQPSTIALELRVFDGGDEVTPHANVTLYRAGDRNKPIATFARASRQVTAVEPGLYDVQAMRVQDGRLMNVTWRERLVVMNYPDERGRHLEVINFKTGFGALQVRPPEGGGLPDVALYAAGARDKEVAPRLSGDGYVLFVVPEGKYDLLVRADKPAWHAAIELSANSTRMWVVQ